MPRSNTEAQNKTRLMESVIGDYFSIHRERVGQPIHTKPIKRLFHHWSARSLKKDYKIDFILEPKDNLLSAGWELGCIGVEAKPTPLEGSKFGKAISQMLDYQSAIFKLGDQSEAQELSMIFLLGPDRFHGVEASILMQEGIGLIRISNNEIKLLHGNGMHPILTLCDSSVEYRRPRFGMGTGHR